MTYCTLMVHLELDRSNDARLQIAGELAEQFDATLIGIAAAEAFRGPYFADGAFAQGVIEQDQADINRRFREVEARFRGALQKRAAKLEWRSAVGLPTDYVVRQARAADLVITGCDRDRVFPDTLRELSPSDLVLQAGRPIFMVPPEAEGLALDKVLVAWKDTREARRAVWDAVPLLRKAKEVRIVENVEIDDHRSAAQNRLDDVAAWLARKGIHASVMVSVAAGDAAARLEVIASEIGAGLTVAGAYGHTRLGERVFGGVTRDLFARSSRCALLAH
ncbi:MAG: universal stress protein [Xanthobacteraceae bacterium]